MKLSERIRDCIGTVLEWADEVAQLERKVATQERVIRRKIEYRTMLEESWLHRVEQLEEENRALSKAGGHLLDVIDALLTDALLTEEDKSMSLSDVKEKYLPNKDIEELRRKPDVAFEDTPVSDIPASP